MSSSFMRGVDESQRTPDGCERGERVVDLVECVSGRVAGAHEAGIRPARRWEHDVHVEAGLEQPSPHGDGQIGGADFNGNDWRLRGSYLESEPRQARPHAADVVPEALPQRTVAPENGQRRLDAGNIGR